MTKLNPSNLQTLILENQTKPAEGPKALVQRLDFSSITGYQLDLLNVEETGQISMIQTIFVDNSTQSTTLTITFAGSNQTIHAEPNTQGYYPVLCPNPANITFSNSGTSAVPVPVFLINVPIAGVVWAAAA
jgi:hypothetical protein